MRHRLQVRVNDELVLDAGAWEEVSGPRGAERLIRPPETTLFHQVLAYLRAKPDPPKRPVRFDGRPRGRGCCGAVAALGLLSGGASRSRQARLARDP